MVYCVYELPERPRKIDYEHISELFGEMNGRSRSNFVSQWQDLNYLPGENQGGHQPRKWIFQKD